LQHKPQRLKDRGGNGDGNPKAHRGSLMHLSFDLNRIARPVAFGSHAYFDKIVLGKT
jgi:hypothetical protein